jgi:hypothetical protein
MFKCFFVRVYVITVGFFSLLLRLGYIMEYSFMIDIMFLLRFEVVFGLLNKDACLSLYRFFLFF